MFSPPLTLNENKNKTNNNNKNNTINKCKKSKWKRFEKNFCFLNLKKYLQETSLHGLRFVGDESISIWERGFFFFALITAFTITTHLIANSYAKWASTPIIIGVNPFPASVFEMPFPAITICNMNMLLASKVANYSDNTPEGVLRGIACGKVEVFDTESYDHLEHFKNNNLNYFNYFVKHAQSCNSMLLHCELYSETLNCSDLFELRITDQGLCCTFNMVHPYFRHKKEKEQPTPGPDGTVPVDWTPEHGYPKILPKKYSPRSGKGIGTAAGLSIVLDAQVEDYYCSSGNSAGFKFTFNNPLELPRVRETGLIAGVGYEHLITMEPQKSVAAPKVRSLPYYKRNCYYSDEGDLIYHKHYTQRNCDNENTIIFLYKACNCIPYYLPLIYPNASTCGAKHLACFVEATKGWRNRDNFIRDEALICLNGCFDYSFIALTFSAPLLEGNYSVKNQYLQKISRKYIRENVAVMHFFFREFWFHGSSINIYVGMTEFLADIGGILGLFLGFSFISLVEIFYYACLCPIFYWMKKIKTKKVKQIAVKEAETPNLNIWLGDEILNVQRNFKTDLYRKPNQFNVSKANKEFIKKIPAARRGIWD